MRRHIAIIPLFALAAVQFGCSRSVVGTYFHDYGPRREYVELKPDKTVTLFEEYYNDGKRERSEWVETGTYVVDGNTVKTHTVYTPRYATNTEKKTVHNWEWQVDAGALVKRPQNHHYQLVRAKNAATADSQSEELEPQLTAAAAQAAIDRWALSHLRGVKPTLNIPTPKGGDRVNTVARVASIKEDSRGHFVTAHLDLSSLPIQDRYDTPSPSVFGTKSYEEVLSEFHAAATAPPKYVLFSGSGEAFFYHCSDGKWFLAIINALPPSSSPIDDSEAHWSIYSEISTGKE